MGFLSMSEIGILVSWLLPTSQQHNPGPQGLSPSESNAGTPTQNAEPSDEESCQDQY